MKKQAIMISLVIAVIALGALLVTAVSYP